jgi:hypothetical protein
MVFIKFNIAKSFIFLNMFGIFHITNPTTASKKLNNYHKFITHIFFLDILYDFSKNDFITKKYVAEYALTFSKDLINELDINSKLYFNSIINKKIEDVLADYIKSGFIKIINIRGKTKMQFPAYNHCYKENKKKYNWLIFYDVDEFIHLTNFNSIKKYLSNKRFNKCNVVYLNQVMHTDSNQIYYYNRSLFERFPKITMNFDEKIGLTKMILKGNRNLTIGNPHILVNEYQCNSNGKLINKLIKKEFLNDNFYYDHFLFKSCEEYLNRLVKTDVVSGIVKGYTLQWFIFYFSVNEVTKEKLDYFENRTGLNMSYFRDRIIKRI